MLLKKECIVINNCRFRLITEDDLPKIAGFYLMGQGYGDMICMVPLLKKTAQLLGRRLEVWTFRPEVFMGIPCLNAHPMDLDAVKKYCTEGNLLIVAPVKGIGIPSRFALHLIDQSAFNIVDLSADDKEIPLPEYGIDRERIRGMIDRFRGMQKIIIHPR